MGRGGMWIDQVYLISRHLQWQIFGSAIIILLRYEMVALSFSMPNHIDVELK
jgi:hypothetical protein